MSAGSKLRKAIEEEVPLQVVGTINAYCARLAERAGFKALYLSGAGAANASFGLPDLGITTLNDVCEDVRRITATTKVPLLVDADTGWGAHLISLGPCANSSAQEPQGVTSKTRSKPSAVGTARTRQSFRPEKWWIASRPRSTAL